MSRWIDLYNNHAYKTTWENIKNAIKAATIDDESIFHEVNELARLKKLIAYIDSTLNSIDPELIPIATWDNFEAQAQHVYSHIVGFNNSKQITYVQTANSYADNLLTFIRPYMLISGDINTTLKKASNDYQSTITKNNRDLLSHISLTRKAIDYNLKEAEKKLNNIQQKETKIEEAYSNIVDSETGLHQKITSIEKDASHKLYDIKDYYDEIFTTTDTTNSIKKEISEAKRVATETKEEIENIASNTKTTTAEIEKFHKKIYGNKGSTEENGGLSKKIDDLYKTLKDFEESQKLKYKTLNEEIESLLPGATSAGLATAYRDLKNSFKKPIENASRIFYISIASLVAFSFILTIESLELWSIKFTKYDDLKNVLNSIIYKLPIYVPIIWLAYFSSKRRSEYQRLEQEYAHKEALAASYHSYKKQLEDLASDDTSILEDLISKTIHAISHNASATLDGKHGDKTPIHELSEKTVDKIGELAKTLTGLIESIKK